MENMGQGTHSTKMGADKLAEDTPNARICLPKLSAQDQKFGISMKKRLHWASLVRASNESL